VRKQIPAPSYFKKEIATQNLPWLAGRPSFPACPSHGLLLWVVGVRRGPLGWNVMS